MPLGLSSLGRSLEEVPLPPVLAGLFGAVAAILVLATPEWMFDRMVLAADLSNLAPSATPPFGEIARIVAAIAAMWLVAGILWPIFALVGALLAPKPQKGKGFHILASFDAPVPDLQLEALIRSPAGTAPASGPVTDVPVDQSTSRIRAVLRRAAHSGELASAKEEVPPKAILATTEVAAIAPQPAGRETASDAVASRTIEPSKHKTRKRQALSGETIDPGVQLLGGSETRH